MIPSYVALTGKIAVAGALLSVLAYGPSEAWTRTKACGSYIRGAVDDATPVELKVETISERISAREVEVTKLRTDVARLEETRGVLDREAGELRTRVQERTQRVAAGEEVQRQAGRVHGQAFDVQQLEQALATERRALEEAERQLREREFRGRLLGERAQLYRRRLDEFVVHLAALRQRLEAVRRLQADNATLEELVSIQAAIDREWAVPGAGTAEFGDGLTAIEVELRARQATLTEQLTGGIGDSQDVLGRAVEVLGAAHAEQTAAR